MALVASPATPARREAERRMLIAAWSLLAAHGGARLGGADEEMAP